MSRTVVRRWLSASIACIALLGGASLAQPQPTREVLVLGGTGQLGAEIVKLLVASGHRVTVFARKESDRSRLQGLPVSYVVGDLLNNADVEAALRGRKVDTVISAVRVEDGDVHFYEKIFTNLTAHAKAAGVSHIVHHGAVGAGANAAKFTHLGWEKVPGLLDRLKDQGLGEDLLRASGVPFTVIRNSRLYPDGTPATGKAELTEDDTVLTPMTRADLARLNVQCVGNAACFGKVYHVKDPSLAWPPPRAASGQ
jgi:uncharacterized protein YbjT (DUF2867 family)